GLRRDDPSRAGRRDTGDRRRGKSLARLARGRARARQAFAGNVSDRRRDALPPLLTPRALAAGAPRGQPVVARDDPKRADQALNERRLSYEDRTGSVDDRVVDRAESDLHGEPHVRLLLVRQRTLRARTDARDQRVTELVAELADRRPEVLVANA